MAFLLSIEDRSRGYQDTVALNEINADTFMPASTVML